MLVETPVEFVWVHQLYPSLMQINRVTSQTYNKLVPNTARGIWQRKLTQVNIMVYVGRRALRSCIAFLHQPSLTKESIGM